MAAGSPFTEVLPLFLATLSNDTWGMAKNNVRLPEPGVASNWLSQYQAAQSPLERDWAAYQQRQRDLDDAVSDWYGFSASHRVAIVNGLPWASP